MNRSKNKTPSHMLSNNCFSKFMQHVHYVLLFLVQHGGKFRPVSNFTELHDVTL